MRRSLGVAPYPTKEMLDPSYNPATYYRGGIPESTGTEDGFSLSDWIDKHQNAIIVAGVALFGFALLTANGRRR